MEEQLKKLKTKSIIVIILALLAITWQFLNYITIKDYFKMDDFSSFEVIIIYSSYAFMVILFLALLSLSYTILRVSMRFHSDKKKDEMLQTTTKINSPEEKTQL